MSDKMKVTVSYGTIKGMIVELPKSFNVMQLLDGFAKAFVSYMCQGGLCSDEVLFSSIGESNCRKAMVGGIEEKFEKGLITEEVKDIFVKTIKDEFCWKSAILRARYPKEVATKMAWKLIFPGKSDEVIEKIMAMESETLEKMNKKN